jgi:hypothetical protein
VKKHLGIATLILATTTTVALAANVPTLFGSGGSGPGAEPEPEFAVLWDQPLSATNTNAYANQEFGDFPTYSCFVADDFVVPATGWSIETIYVPNGAWNGATTISVASMLHFEIYADAAGIPAGNPGGVAPVWSLAVVPTDPQITLSIGSGGFDTSVLATLTTPIDLAAGTYWLVFYPTADFATAGQFGRQGSDTTNGLGTQWINPGGGFGNGTAWQSWSILGATLQDAAFRLEGTVLPVELQSLSIE